MEFLQFGAGRAGCCCQAAVDIWNLDLLKSQSATGPFPPLQRDTCKGTIQKFWWHWHLPAIFFLLMPLWKAQTSLLSSASFCYFVRFFFSFPNHSSTNVMVLLPVEKWINKAHELFTKINSLLTQGQCSSQRTEPVKMFINNRSRLLIKLSQLVLPLCLASKPAVFQGISGLLKSPTQPQLLPNILCLLAQFQLIKATAKTGGYSELNMFKYSSATGGENIDSMDTCKLWSEV